MSDCALAIYEFDRSGYKYPRRWMARWGNLSIAHAADSQDFKEYANTRKQCQDLILPMRMPVDIHAWPGEVLL